MVTHKFNLKFRVKVSYDKDDELWYADCEDLQGAHSIGDTEQEALDNLAEVITDRVAAGLDYLGEAKNRRKASHHVHARAPSPGLIEVCA